MNVATIDPTRCDRQPGCPSRRFCPNGAIVRPDSIGGPLPWTVDPELCTGCGMCVRVCPMSAVSMVAHER